MERVERSAVIRAVLVVAAITAIGGAVRFYHLGTPSDKYFDEVYYASDGCLFAGFEYTECGLDRNSEASWVHPPLGKYLIAWGVDGFGNTPVGWRVSAAAAGTATIALTGALGFLLSRKALWAGVAALLLATEHLNFVQSRISMLDIFLVFFVVLGFLLLVWDKVRRDRLDDRTGGEALPADWSGGPTPDGTFGPDPGGSLQPETQAATLTAALPERAPATGPARLGWSGLRPLRLGAGAAFGAAMAVKWSGIYALGAAVVLAVAWERTRRKRAGLEHPLPTALLEEGPTLLLAFVVIPALTYGLTWIVWLSNHDWSLTALYRNHRAIADYHFTLSAFEDNGEPVHPYMSRAWTWLVLTRPVAYFYTGGDGTATEILGIGNPFLFWGALIVIPYLVLSWWGNRDWRAGAILVPILFQYVPWLFVTRPLFLFYMAPVTPFLALGATHVLRDLATARWANRRIMGAAAGVAVAVSVGLFVFFWPVLVGDTISMAAWHDRIWFSSWI